MVGLLDGGGLIMTGPVLLIPTTTKFENPSQLCLMSTGPSQKGFIYHKTGLEKKFVKGGDLQIFQEHVYEHLVETGMDTTAYLNDPHTSTEMLLVVKEHAKFTLNNTIATSITITTKSNKYNRENNKAACKFLIDGLDKILAEQVSEWLKPNYGFS
jgi:hypothetical protein